MNWFVSKAIVPFLVAIVLSSSTGCHMFGSRRAATDIEFPTSVAGNSVTSRSNQLKINFLQLRQDPPDEYILAPGDVLGVYIEGITGSAEAGPPVHFPEDNSQDPSIGFPIPIRDDGKISLPIVGGIYVAGATLPEVEEKVLAEYTDRRRILPRDTARVIVTLMRPRRYNIVVIREDASSQAFNLQQNQSQGGLFLGESKKGETFSVNLKAYENDVLHALSESGGLPGEDAKNEIVILRGTFRDARQNPYLMDTLLDANRRVDVIDKSLVTRIPIRLPPGASIPKILEEDVILEDGDVLLIEGRETEVFYTGGLLEGGQHPIPRDYDLDVLGAIAVAGGSLSTAAGGQSGSLLGSQGSTSTLVPASKIRILRQLSNGQQYEIELNLKEVQRDPTQRIVVQPGDVVILEYRTREILVNTMGNLLTTASFGLFNRF